MNYNFELSRFLDDLRKRHRITYEAYVKYRGMADTLAMENDRLEKECKEYKYRAELAEEMYSAIRDCQVEKDDAAYRQE